VVAAFDALPEHVRASIRAKQAAKKAKKAKKAKQPRATSPKTNADKSKDAPALPPGQRRSVTAAEYMRAAPHRFKDRQIPPALSSVPLLVNAALSPDSGIEKCGYFQFYGSEAELWEPAFFAFLAHSGFFVITDHKGEPLPELQPFYGVLTEATFEGSRFNRACLAKLGREGGCPYKLVDSAADADRCWRALEDYHVEKHECNWLTRKYLAAMEKASEKRGVNYRLHIVEMQDGDGKVVAAEFGFSCGSVYTSLSGWCERTGDRLGEVQLVLLGRWLFKSGYAFWSLGHCYVPEMQYKQNLGQVIYERAAFLELLEKHSGKFVGGGMERKLGGEVQGRDLLAAGGR
jgi:hypothetical protein